jgi:dihydroxy-acid dehydratase
MAGRVGADLDLDEFDKLSKRACRCLGNIRPSGKYLMEDFFYAGGLRATAARVCRDVLNVDCTHRQRPRRWARTSQGRASTTTT